MVFLLVLSCFVTVDSASAVIRRVPADYGTIQAAITAALDLDTVLVADGTYYGVGNRNLDFGGKAITLTSERGPLSCIIDLQVQERGFIFYSGEDEYSIVKGFTIQRGYGVTGPGGAVHCDSSSPTFLNCIFKDCQVTSGYSGAAVYTTNASPQFHHCLFIDNSCLNSSGGAAYCSSGYPKFRNCLFVGNYAYYNGGAIYCLNSPVEIANCTITQNTIYYGTGAGGIYCDNSSPSILNSILWANSPIQIGIAGSSTPVVTYCDVQGGYSGTGNFDSDPLFIRGLYCDYYLSQITAGQSVNSPCLDVGDAAASAVCFSSYDGNVCMSSLTTRTDNALDAGQVDLGAHLLLPPAPTASPTPTPAVTNTPVSIKRVPADYATIQDAINAANYGDMVLVADGTYFGTGNKELTFSGKRITVKSEHGAEQTIIDCEQSGSAFYFHNQEDHNSVLQGFTIQRGCSTSHEGGGIRCENSSPLIKDCIIKSCSITASGWDGGGLSCYNASPTVSGCYFYMNDAAWGRGGGISCEYSSAVILDCTFRYNTGTGGGAIYAYFNSPVIMNCTFIENTASYGGAVFTDYSQADLINCVFIENSATGNYGGGVYIHYSPARVANCLLTGNSAVYGGAICCNDVDPEILSCTIVNNIATGYGGGVYCNVSAPTIKNCILWGDTNQEIYLTTDSYAWVSYCDVSGGYPGVGNISVIPRFASGFFGVNYLSQQPVQPLNSQCVNAGSDLAANLCYRTTCLDEVTTRTDSVLDTSQADIGYHYPVQPSPSLTPTYTPTATIVPPTFTPAVILRVPSQYSTIQAAINAAVDGNLVLVADGTYWGTDNRDIEFFGKDITVASEHGPYECFIDCENTGPAFYFHHNEDYGSVLQGFTIQRGGGPIHGGGISCYQSSPRIRDCIIRFNTTYSGGHGSGIYCYKANPLLENCIITRNSTASYGGGIYSYYSSPVIKNSVLFDNSAYEGGGLYAYLHAPVIDHCVIDNNCASTYGSGIRANTSSIIITNSVIMNNSGTNAVGGGLSANHCEPILINNIIADNYGNQGGAVYCNCADPKVLNCTFADNWATTGGAIHCVDSSPVVTNSILWGNAPTEIVGVTEFADPLVSYSNVTGGYSGDGNINLNPLFVNGFYGSYYLSQIIAGQGADSPCVDTGNALAADLCYLTGCFADRTTRTDSVTDAGQIDMGFHHYSGSPTVTATPSPLPTLLPGSATPNAILQVPANYATIQDAIDAAIDGNLVLVADGTYTGTRNRELNFFGKRIRVASQNGPLSCVIDCENNGRAFYFHYGEERDSIVDGFTITRGGGPIHGGAFQIVNSSPTITNCIMEDGTLYSGGRGGAIDAYLSSAYIHNCTITRNHAAAGGGGIHAEYSPLLIADCMISNNSSYRGGGIYFYFLAPVITNTTITYNTSVSSGGGVDCDVAAGRFINTIITSNTANAGNGGGVRAVFAPPIFDNCVLAENHAIGGYGGGLYTSHNEAIIRHCTFTGNASTYPGGAIYADNCAPHITNSILYGNSPDEIGRLASSKYWPVVNYCTVEDGYSGTGNINANPVFVTGSLGPYYLSQIAAGQPSNSPCLNAGSATAAAACIYVFNYGSLCMDHCFTRTDHGLDASTVDIGFHYWIPQAPPATPTFTPVVPTNTPTRTPTQPTATFTGTPTVTATQPSATPSATFTSSPTSTITPTGSPGTPVQTYTPTNTPSGATPTTTASVTPAAIPTTSTSVLGLLIAVFCILLVQGVRRFR